MALKDILESTKKPHTVTFKAEDGELLRSISLRS